VDFATADLYLGPTLATVDLDVNDLKRNLAYAHICGVPVVANRSELAARLAIYERDLFRTGFESGEGADWTRYKLTAFEDADVARGTGSPRYVAARCAAVAR
jgi:hypothetical protein